MNKTLLFLLLAVLHVSAYGQAKIVFNSTSIDFGDVNTLITPLKAEFKFKNEGNEPLTIIKVASSYTHFKIDYPKVAIEPGKEGVITVEGSFEMPGKKTKSVSVMTSGQVEMTRLYVKCNNTTEIHDLLYVERDELVQGGRYDIWLDNNVKKNLTGIDNQITYQVVVKFEIDSKGKIAKADYEKNNLPQSIINEIERLVNISPVFTADYYGKQYKETITINRYHYSNPNDKAYGIVSGGIDRKDLLRQVNGSLMDLNFSDVFNNYFRIHVDFIIERDGTITNLMSEIYSDSPVEYVSHVKEAIKKVARVAKTKPGIADGKTCRTKYWVYVLFPKNK